MPEMFLTAEMLDDKIKATTSLAGRLHALQALARQSRTNKEISWSAPEIADLSPKKAKAGNDTMPADRRHALEALALNQRTNKEIASQAQKLNDMAREANSRLQD